MEAKSVQREIARPTRWEALPERCLSTPYPRTHATRWFAGAGFTAVCYGPSLQHDPGGDPGVPNAFNVAALCTNEVNEDWEEPYFSALRTRYQNAVSNGGFVITPFEPHEEPVPTSETCPDCGG